MKPVDYRNTTFADIKARLVETRLEVYEALKLHGPCTTEALAAAMRPNDPLYVLTVRPRVTELYQLGFAVLVEEVATKLEDSAGNHVATLTYPPRSGCGWYRASSDFEARQLFDAAKRNAMRTQTLLNI